MSAKRGEQRRRRQRIYQEALGIHTGDTVRTSYGSGPYEVWSIWGPRYVFDGGLDVIIHLWPVISLTCIRSGDEKPRFDATGSHFYFLNEIRQVVMPDGSSRWFSDQNEEVFVEPSRRPVALPVDMFASYPPIPEPPVWQVGVDYSPREDGNLRLWRCTRCGTDFNGPPASSWARVATCVRCGHWLAHPIYVMPPSAGWSSFTLENSSGAPPDWYVRRPRPEGIELAPAPPPPIALPPAPADRIVRIREERAE